MKLKIRNISEVKDERLLELFFGGANKTSESQQNIQNYTYRAKFMPKAKTKVKKAK